MHAVPDQLNQPRRIAAVILLGAVGSLVFMVLPMLVGAFSERLYFSEEQVGLLGSADMFGMFASAALAMAWIRRWDWRAVAWLAGGLLIATHLASAFLTGFAGLLGVRFLSGFAGGALMSIALTALGDSRDPDRCFGLFICAQMLLGALALWQFPAVLAAFGLPGAFVALAGVSVAVAAVIPLIPRAGKPVGEAPATARRERSLGAGLAALLACLVFNLGIMAIWAFMERIGDAAGLETGFIGSVLGASLLAGLAGAGAAAALGRRLGRRAPLLATLVLQLIALGLLAGDPQAAGYVLAVMLFSFGWNFPVPYQLAITVSVDPSGRLVVLFLSAVKLGYAAGPAIAGLLLAAGGGFQPLLLLGALAFVASAAVFLSVARRGLPGTQPARGGEPA